MFKRVMENALQVNLSVRSLMLAEYLNKLLPNDNNRDRRLDLSLKEEQLFIHTISGAVINWLQEKRQDFEIHARFTVEMVSGKRWCFTTCALFMLCPRRFYVTAFPQHEWFNSNKLLIPNPFVINNTLIIPRWSSNIVNDKGSTSSRIEEAEPGFDFNEEEIKKLKIWPGGVIPYYIDEFSFDKVIRDRIRSFLDMTNSMTGLNFLELHRPPDDDETRWVFFINRQGLLSCVDHPFKNFTSEGVQKILLGYDCLSNGGELAELVLALVGVPPQHNAPNRNKYIEIVKENIMPGKAHLFEILQDREWLFHEIAYDFGSAGHYNLHKYTINGKATIKPLNAAQAFTIGQGKGFSYTDIWKIRMIYNYITKKQIKSASMPKCNKLFNLGTNFSNDVHHSEDDVQPRKKPNKYLGLPDELIESPTNNQGTKNKTENNPVNTDKETIKDESGEETNPEKEQNSRNEDEKSGHSDEKLNNEYITDENSIVQSDYEADDNYKDAKPHELKFTRPGQKNS